MDVSLSTQSAAVAVTLLPFTVPVTTRVQVFCSGNAAFHVPPMI
jgi:hypothetical protein